MMACGCGLSPSLGSNCMSCYPCTKYATRKYTRNWQRHPTRTFSDTYSSPRKGLVREPDKSSLPCQFSNNLSNLVCHAPWPTHNDSRLEAVPGHLPVQDTRNVQPPTHPA